MCQRVKVMIFFYWVFPLTTEVLMHSYPVEMQVSLFAMPPEGHRLRGVQRGDRLPQVENPDAAPHSAHSTQHPHHHPGQQAAQPGRWRWKRRRQTDKYVQSLLQIQTHHTETLTKVLCGTLEPNKCPRWAVACRQAVGCWFFWAQERRKGVQGQTEEGQGAQKQSGAIHHSDR